MKHKKKFHTHTQKWWGKTYAYGHKPIENASRGCRGCDLMVIGFTATYAISAYHQWCCEFESQSTLYEVCQWLVTGRWFSPGPPVSSTNKTDHHNITEILLKVALNTIKRNKNWERFLLRILKIPNIKWVRHIIQ